MAFCICLGFWMHSSPAGAEALTRFLYIQKPDMSTVSLSAFCGVVTVCAAHARNV